jgi:hypothetical protein
MKNGWLISLMRKSGQMAVAAILVAVFVILFTFLDRAPTTPSEVATSRKPPETVANCISERNHGKFRLLAPETFEVTVINGRGAILSHFLIGRDRSATRVEERRPRISGFLVRWKSCL